MSEKSVPPPPPASPTQAERDRLLQLHIAEYNALTTRSTYYITIAASLFSVLAVVLTLVTLIWNITSNHALLIWGTAIIFQAFLLALLVNSQLQYENIKYIEKMLRPLVETLLDPSSGFWRYEHYLSDQRQDAPQSWEYLPILIAAGVVIGAFVGRIFDLAHHNNTSPSLSALTMPDWVAGGGVNMVFLGVVIYNSIRTVAFRRSIF